LIILQAILINRRIRILLYHQVLNQLLFLFLIIHLRLKKILHVHIIKWLFLDILMLNVDYLRRWVNLFIRAVHIEGQWVSHSILFFTLYIVATCFVLVEGRDIWMLQSREHLGGFLLTKSGFQIFFYWCRRFVASLFVLLLSTCNRMILNICIYNIISPINHVFLVWYEISLMFLLRLSLGLLMIELRLLKICTDRHILQIREHLGQCLRFSCYVLFNLALLATDVLGSEVYHFIIALYTI
jgi:hypothetical protein